MASNFYTILSRDYAAKQSVVQSALDAAYDAFMQANLGGGKAARVREGYWYDLEEAGASSYNHSNELTFGSSTNAYGFPYAAILKFTVPQSKVFAFYGISDYAANPSLAAWEVEQNGVAFPLFYIVPHLYTSEDKTAYLNGTLPALIPNRSATITLYGTAATTDPIDLKFMVAEPPAEL